MDMLQSIVLYLDDPYLVARFQRFCGLSYNENSARSAPSSNMYSQSGLKNSSIVFRDEDDPWKVCHYDQNGAKVPDEDESSDKCIRRNVKAPKPSGVTETDAAADQVNLQNGGQPIKNTTSNPDGKKNELPYKIQYKSLYYLFSFGAALGDELFYTTFFPFILWNLDFFVSRKVVVMWWITLYLGQATKDIVKRPRPISPPVIKLEARYELEYGMPSTHAMVGTCIPFSMLYLFHQRYDFPFNIGLMLAIAWTTLISLSRIYLGMHSVLDIIVGVLYVCIILPLIYPYLQVLDHFSVTHPVAPFFTIGVPFLLCLLYPPVDKWNTARRDTTLLIGVGAGISVGSWLCYQHGFATSSYPIPVPLELPSITAVILCFIRLIIGVPIMLITAELLRLIIRNICKHIFGINIKDPKIKRMQIYELTDSFLPFLIVAINVTYGIPMIFSVLGIDRPSYYAEILPPVSI
ncbi:sphingosine-1-phosphate phosphatase 2 [Octopus sinensis]|uniref:Sphingosine-1-phosphate phosphatase 2 n=1 Tax=Octopus sinensis TaxID=2607531 RepID=A0A6P7SX79_9MOLL|nr:sphingosine-1-phosphate phosphatase 2 [Octopus sinensis]